MGHLVHEIAHGESLYGIAREYGIDIRDLQVQRGAKIFDLGTGNQSFDPKSLGPGDKVLVPDLTQVASRSEECGIQHEEGTSHE
ncbi:MAG: LysM peptidoglycan-binding domain-containing protein [Polyangiaceae bacterium]|nr:LysM peptidoglycan-binding domain-containing protein [Polyangiaceae bacterium]